MGNSEKKSKSPRKRIRRSGQTRKTAPLLRYNFKNKAEARKEITDALNLHKSSSVLVSSTSSNSTSARVPLSVDSSDGSSSSLNGPTQERIRFTGTAGNYDYSFSLSDPNMIWNARSVPDQYQVHQWCCCCYNYTTYQVGSIPAPEPTWSTTAPSVLSVSTQAHIQVPEFEWPEELWSSHFWWSGFLSSLDGQHCDQSHHGDAFSKSNLDSKGLYGGHSYPPVDETRINECADDYDHSVADDWLIVPTANEDEV